MSEYLAVFNDFNWLGKLLLGPILIPVFFLWVLMDLLFLKKEPK